MSTHEQTRRAHRIVDALKDSRILSSPDVDFLRSFLPELPKQMTLEEIAWDIHFAWCETSGNDWKEELFGNLEKWLSEQHTQLRAHLEGVKSQAHPALPAGMRLADHAEHGRVVSIGWLDEKGDHFCVYYDKNYKHGIYALLEADSLTFVDAEPAHPEFLETEANYQNAPAGTVAAKDGWLAWVKQKNGDWSCDGGSEEGSILAQTGKRRVLRWGWTNE